MSSQVALERLEILWRKLEDEGRYVCANTVSVAIDEIKQLRDALTAYATLDEAHANCEECEGLGAPEACEKCFPLADAARLKMRAALAQPEHV